MLQAKTARCAAIGAPWAAEASHSAPKPKAPPKPRAPKRLTYDWSYDEGPKRRSLSSRRKRVRAVDELTDEQRAVLEGFNMDDFEAYERRRPL